MASYEKGSHAIDGERLFVNVVEYETTQDAVLEAGERRVNKVLCQTLAGPGPEKEN